MARPKKGTTLDRRVSVRLSREVAEGYEVAAEALGVPAGQLMRQVLTLEVRELRELLAAIEQVEGEAPYRAWRWKEIEAARRSGGGFTQRLRQEARRRLVEGASTGSTR
jgi:predicted HicB family RNase H-like nuclease